MLAFKSPRQKSNFVSVTLKEKEEENSFIQRLSYWLPSSLTIQLTAHRKNEVSRTQWLPRHCWPSPTENELWKSYIKSTLFWRFLIFYGFPHAFFPTFFLLVTHCRDILVSTMQLLSCSVFEKHNVPPQAQWDLQDLHSGSRGRETAVFVKTCSHPTWAEGRADHLAFPILSEKTCKCDIWVSTLCFVHQEDFKGRPPSWSKDKPSEEMLKPIPFALCSLFFNKIKINFIFDWGTSLDRLEILK